MILKLIYSISIFFITSNCFSQLKQIDTNQDFCNQLSNKVSILALGDPTHYEGEITSQRVDLIKKLILQKNFKTIAFEANILEMYYANKSFQQSANPDDLFKGLYRNFRSRELLELFEWVAKERKKGNQINIIGFDTRFSGKETFTTYKNAIEKNIEIDKIFNQKEKEEYFKYFNWATIINLKALFRNNTKTLEVWISGTRKLLKHIKADDSEKQFLKQGLENILMLHDPEHDPLLKEKSKHYKADYYMGNNMQFLKKHFGQDHKMILFGSSTHFMKDPKKNYSPVWKNVKMTLGYRLNKIYTDEYYFLAYSAYDGQTIKEAKIESYESLLGSNLQNGLQLINFSKHSSAPVQLNNKKECRIFGHSYMSMDVPAICDGIMVVSNRTSRSKYKSR